MLLVSGGLAGIIAYAPVFISLEVGVRDVSKVPETQAIGASTIAC